VTRSFFSALRPFLQSSLTAPFLVVVALATGCRESPSARSSGTITADTLILAGSGDTVDFAMLTGPAPSRNGYVVVGPVMTKSGQQLALYDSLGQLVKLFAPRGRGPGELVGVSVKGFGPGDSLFAHDAGTKRINVFTPPPELRHARAFTVPAFGGPRFGSRRLLLGQVLFERILNPPREITWTGELLRTFGRPAPTNEHWQGFRAVAPAGDSLMWSAHRRRYVIDLLGPDSVIRQIRRSTEWFPDDTATRTTSWKERPGPRISSVAEDDAGVLWVVISRPTKGWYPVDPGGSMRGPDGIPTGIMPEASTERFESVVEALDAATGELLASAVFSPTVFNFVAPAVVFQKIEDADGAYSIRLLRLRLQR
jgi:hypothetical protein